MVAFTNALLFVFNLIPIPPLDGSKVIFPFLPRALDGFVDFMNQYGPMILLGLILISFVTNFPILGILLAPVQPLLTFLVSPRSSESISARALSGACQHFSISAISSNGLVYDQEAGSFERRCRCQSESFALAEMLRA